MDETCANLESTILSSDSQEDLNINSCFYSSFFFVINIFVAHYYKYDFYSNIFAVLFTTSVIHHSNNNIYTNIVDKVAIYVVVFYGGWLLFNKITNREKMEYTSYNLVLICLIVLSFLSTIYLYIYGYLTRTYCFYEDKMIANSYHSFLHFISCLGHIGIMVL